MDFAEAMRWLADRENLEASRSRSRLSAPSLDGMTELVGLLAEPQQAYPVIHLTGTNGKTSTARIVTRLLEVAGLSVGTYTSPHLQHITERISRNGEPIPEAELAQAIAAVAGVSEFLAEPPRYFEVLTAAAFRWFADVAVHAAVVEVGMLGQWDATNVVDSKVAVLTNVGADHLDYAGSIEAVAREKSGIAKPGGIFVLGETDPELAHVFAGIVADEVWRKGDDFALLENTVALGGRLLRIRTPTSMYDGLYLRLHGAYQGENAAIALASAEAFLGRPLDQDLVTEAFDTVSSPGRLEVMQRRPLVVLDGAHNPAGASALAGALEEDFAEPDRWTLVIGVLEPHDPEEFLRSLALADVGLVVACEPDSPRAVPASEVVAAARALGLRAVAGETVAESLGIALDASSEDDAVVVTGSLYAVGEARAALGHRRG